MDLSPADKKHILLVEDDEFISDVYMVKLRKEGFEVEWANNGEVALQKARARKPDLILLDLIMPVKNGFETLQELKADPLLKDVRVITLTNLSQEEDVKAVMSLGAVDYCIKASVSFGEMMEKIKTNLALALV